MFEFKDHTADLIIYAKGSTLSELVKETINAFVALIDVNAKPDFCKIIMHKAPNEKMFFVELLNKIIAISESEGITPVSAEVIYAKEWEAKIKICFKKQYPPNRVKAATYFGFKYKPYEVEITLDL